MPMPLLHSVKRSWKMPGKLQISPTACITAAFLLLILPLPWLLAAAVAAVFHELCHYAALRLCGTGLRSFRIGASGAAMEIPPLPYAKELLCALAGPLGSLSLLLIGRWFPRIAVCAAFHALYNLLPLYPLDGGRALHCGARLLLPPKTADTVCSAAEHICLTAICLTALYATLVLHLGLLPLLMAALLLVKRQKVKIPCKPARLGVQ